MGNNMENKFNPNSVKGNIKINQNPGSVTTLVIFSKDVSNSLPNLRAGRVCRD